MAADLEPFPASPMVKWFCDLAATDTQTVLEANNLVAPVGRLLEDARTDPAALHSVGDAMFRAHIRRGGAE